MAIGKYLVGGPWANRVGVFPNGTTLFFSLHGFTGRYVNWCWEDKECR